MSRDPRDYYRYIVERKASREVHSLQEYFRDEAGLVSHERARSAWSAELASGRLNAPRLYAHIPFCRSRCRFCMYESDALGRAALPDACVSHLVAQARHHAPAFREVRFRGLYLGGGTPSLLSEAQMDALFAALGTSFSFARGEDFTFEMNPRDATRAKARALVRAGCGRVSMGVQSLSRRELLRAGRGAQTFAQVSRAVSLLQEEGVKRVNCDLLLGLPGASARTVLAGVRRVAALEPTSITLYFVQPQSGLTYLGPGGADFYTARARLERAVEEGLVDIAARAGMTVTGNAHGRYLSRTPPTPAEAAEEGAERSELGLGRYSLSFAAGAFQYQDVSPTLDFDPAAPVLDMKAFTREDRIANLALRAYCDEGRVPETPLLARYGVRPSDHFHEGLSYLRSRGRARLEEGAIHLLSRAADERMTDMLVLLDLGRGRVLRRFMDRRPTHAHAR